MFRTATLVAAGACALAAAQSAPPSSRNPVSTPLLADFDGDGRLDSARLTPGGIEVTLGGASGVLAVQASHLAAGDMDCDGRLDLVLDGGRTWVLNPQIAAAVAGSGRVPVAPLDFVKVWDSSATLLETATRHIIADFDGDGRNELITADYNGPVGADVATLRMFESTGDNQWVEVWSFSAGPRVWSGMAAADSDGDGKIELIAGKIGGSYLGGAYVGPRVYVFESDGDNSLALDHLLEVDPSPASAAFSFMDDLAVGDANGDGKLDIAVGLSDNETVFSSTWGTRVRLYTWNKPFSQYDLKFNHTQTNIGVGYLTAIDVGDSDADGWGEIIWFDRVVPTVYRAEYAPLEFIVKSASTGVPAGVCMDVNVADVDADGKVELLCGTSVGVNGHVHVIESTGDDAYAPAFEDSVGIGNTVLYVDSDGRTPPLIAGAAHSGQVLVLRYEPSADSFNTVDFFAVPGAPQLHTVTVGPLDGACQTELMLTRVAGGPGGSGVYEQREPIGCDKCPGDLDSDGLVGQSDLGILLAGFGCSGGAPDPPHDCPGDLDGDGDTDQADLGALLAVFGKSCP